MTSQTRPLGITLIALLYLVEALLSLMAALTILNASANTGLLALLEQLQIPAAWSSLLAVPPLLAAGLAGLVGRGLWRLQEWARLASIVLTFLLSLTALLALGLSFTLAGMAPSAGLLSGIALVVFEIGRASCRERV